MIGIRTSRRQMRRRLGRLVSRSSLYWRDLIADSFSIVIATQPAGETIIEGLEEGEASEVLPPMNKKRKRKEENVKSSTTEYGVSRGIDFIDVACVINFDLPFSSRSYTHRVGRTARAGRTGTSLSFVVPRELWGKKKQNDISLDTAKRDESVFGRIERDQKAKGGEVKEYKFDMKQVEGFRYRMEDGLRAVTKAAVREARIKEIKNEVVNSEKLKVRAPPLLRSSLAHCTLDGRLISRTTQEISPSSATTNHSIPPESNRISNTSQAT